MGTTVWKCRMMFPAIVAGLSLVASGCSESTTRDDVAGAREELREEHQDTAEAQREARENVAEAQRDAQPYTVNKPTIDGDAAEARDDVADAQQDANEAVREEIQEKNEAAVDLRTTEQKFAATQARDRFVADMEQKLADAEVRIDELKSSASDAEGTNKEAMDRTIETLQSQHDHAEEALSNLTSAELADWQAHREMVQVALQDLNKTMSSVR